MNQRPPEQLGLWTDEGVAFVDAAGQGEGGESRLTSSVTAAPGAQAASTAAEARATVPEAALLGSLPVFRHPRTEREIRLGKALVGYECKRVRRRSIGMVVSDEGLSVRAPTWVSWADIELALRSKERWICAKLVDQRERARKRVSAQIDWQAGCVRNHSRGTELPFEPLSESDSLMIAAGGIIGYLKATQNEEKNGS